MAAGISGGFCDVPPVPALPAVGAISAGARSASKLVEEQAAANAVAPASSSPERAYGARRRIRGDTHPNIALEKRRKSSRRGNKLVMQRHEYGQRHGNPTTLALR
jgi:hypothetical protein